VKTNATAANTASYTGVHQRQPRVSVLSVLIALALGPTSVLAQQSSEQGATTLDGISVTGVRASIQKSLVDKRNAPGIVDAISAEDMGKFPDLNLSESLQRIPGITLDRNSNGEGHAINLRGLGPEFTRVEINGMSGMSNGGESRFGESEGGRGFSFEIFASELFSKATVYKTGLAEVDEGGLAGTVRLETPRPLDSEGTKFTGIALGNYSDTTSRTDPRTALLFSHNHNDIFGIAASIAWSEADFVSNSLEGGSWRPFAPSNTGTRASDEVRAAWNANGPRYYSFNEQRDTTGGTLTLQFKPSDILNITLDGLYGKLGSDRLAQRDDMAIEGGANIPSNTVIEDGIIVSGDFTGIQQRVGANVYHTDETYKQAVMQLEWTPDEYWSIRPLIGYAKRQAERARDLYSFRLADGDTFDPGTVSYERRGNFLDFRSTHTNFDSRPEDFLFNVFISRPSYDQDQEKQARVDVSRYFAGNDHVLKFGARYNDHTKDRVASQWRLQRDGVPATSLPGLDSAYMYLPYRVKGSAAWVPTRILAVDKNKIQEVFFPNGAPVAGTRIDVLNGFGAQETWSIQEKAASMWMQMDLNFSNWMLIPGLRYVRTEQISSGSDVANANLPTEVVTPVRVSKTYNGLLPSLTARYDVSNEVVLRAGYARTLTRPSLPSLAPSESVRGIDASGGNGSRGNPALEPYYAHNLDLGAEWYFSSEGLVAANAFYKKISNFIDTRVFVEDRTFPRQADGVLVTGPITFTEPVNGVSASIKGIELTAQSRFSRLPGALSHLGGILNYSHTESSADFATEGDVRSQGLPGLSKNSINAVLYYDDGRLDARLAYAWRERYLANFSDNFGIPRFTDDYGQLDLSVNYRINANISILGQVLNLTKEQRIDHSSPRYLPYAVAEVDRRYMLGLRVAF